MTTETAIALPDPASVGARFLGCIGAAVSSPPLSDSDIRNALCRPAFRRSDANAGPEPRTVWDVVKPGEQLCIVVSDQTRKSATDRMLPALVDGLVARSCSPTDMRILFATGIHRHPSPAEVENILGPRMASMFEGRIHFHDPDNPAGLVAVGRTRRGHEVLLNRMVVEARRLILTGTVTCHYHAGYGGGRKSLVPGLAGRATIAHNHSLTLHPSENRVHPGVMIGSMEGNPVAEEMLEAARLRPPDCIVNTVLAPDGTLAGVFAGDMELAHREACGLADRLFRFDIEKPAHLVIASAGKATNWIQSHKALFNASRAAGPAGRIVLLAPCPEGIGDEGFRHWVRLRSVDAICAGLRRSPEVLGQTALSTVVRGARTILVTRMPAADLADLGIASAPGVTEAVAASLDALRRDGVREPTFYTMPYASHTVPFPAR